MKRFFKNKLEALLENMMSWYQLFSINFSSVFSEDWIKEKRKKIQWGRSLQQAISESRSGQSHLRIQYLD